VSTCTHLSVQSDLRNPLWYIILHAHISQSLDDAHEECVIFVHTKLHCEVLVNNTFELMFKLVTSTLCLAKEGVVLIIEAILAFS